MQATLKHPGQGTAIRLVSAVTFATLLAAHTGCMAQASPDAAPVPPPPAVAGTTSSAPPLPGAVAPATPGALRAPRVDAVADVTTQATVSRFITNPDGDVDGFLTVDGALVHLPPHMGTQLTSTVHPGDSVQVSGWRDAGGGLTAQRITRARTGQQVIDHPPPPGTPPLPRELRGAGLTRLSVQGHVAHITTARRGEPDGVILTDGTVIKLTPPVARQFPALLQAGATVSAQGYGTRNAYGTALQATAFGSPGNLTQLYARFPPNP